jgi:hypothetical protein
MNTSLNCPSKILKEVMYNNLIYFVFIDNTANSAKSTEAAIYSFLDMCRTPLMGALIQLEYSDTLANKDNSFQNHIR